MSAGGAEEPGRGEVHHDRAGGLVDLGAQRVAERGRAGEVDLAGHRQHDEADLDRAVDRDAGDGDGATGAELAHDERVEVTAGPAGGGEGTTHGCTGYARQTGRDHLEVGTHRPHVPGDFFAVTSKWPWGNG